MIPPIPLLLLLFFFFLPPNKLKVIYKTCHFQHVKIPILIAGNGWLFIFVGKSLFIIEVYCLRIKKIFHRESWIGVKICFWISSVPDLSFSQVTKDVKLDSWRIIQKVKLRQVHSEISNESLSILAEILCFLSVLFPLFRLKADSEKARSFLWSYIIL